ncbi:MAG: hypothetical protein A2133_02085 [Actinobacteria bacterium RBG_16_64_13]|nr:MAG: hypothetical protein A2133_02085 [Actinobacteria bacterium RBG_16_64_13]
MTYARADVVSRPNRLTEITLFTRGDALKVSTWSGLPHGCAEALEAMGVTVHRVDTSPGRRIQRLIRYIYRLSRVLRLDDGYLRQVIVSRAERHNVKQACRSYPGSQCNLFLTFSFSSRSSSDLPAVHYCDQCFAELLEGQGRAGLSRGERLRLAQEELALNGAALLLSTNSHCIEFLTRRYGLRHVFGAPVYGMNLTGYGGEPRPPFESKSGSKDIVFVGSSLANRGLDVLLEAFRRFSLSTGREYSLHIVGFEEGAVPGDWPSTQWHGRLDKSVPDQARRYWGLLEQARMFVIPSRKGPLPGVILEAQYLGTPVITTNVWGAEQLVQDGKTALVLEEATPESVYEAMSRLASDRDLWGELARNGQEHALQWTWEQAAATLLEQMELVAVGQNPHGGTDPERAGATTVREVTVFTIGDSRSPSTWSNVPYCFAEALLAKGMRVNRVDISPSRTASAICDGPIWRTLRVASRRYPHTYSRSLVNYVNVKHRIKKALREHPDADANIFLSFSHSSAGLSRAPAVQICDWPYEHYFGQFHEQEPDRFEKRSIRRENKLIERSDLVISLFPGAAEHMAARYSKGNVRYLGNAVNSLQEPQEGPALDKKSRSAALLLVGSKKYLEGARCLIAAFELLKEEYPGLTLDLVGLSAGEFLRLPEGVTCHGYLDKGALSDRELYYSLLQSAKILINTTPKWAAFSATLEAMYHYTPVIVPPGAEFVQMFGANIPFGRYCEENEPEPLSQAIRAILSDPSYPSLCTAANRAARAHTWDAFVDRLMESIDKLATKAHV